MVELIIVEDENIVRLGLAALLDWEAKGYHIAGLFKNGREALDYLREHEADIVITDIRMPVMDGEELIARIREFSDSMEIVVLSNFDDFEIVKNCFKIGITDYILKQDIEPESFLALLDEVAGKRKKKEARLLPIHEEQKRQLFFSDFRDAGFVLENEKISSAYRELESCFVGKEFLAVRLCLVRERDHRRYDRHNPQPAAVKESIRESGTLFFEEAVVLDDAGGYLVFLWQETGEGSEEKIASWIRRLDFVMREYFQMYVQAGVSEPFDSLAGAGKARLEADLAWQSLFYYPEEAYRRYGKGRGEYQEETSFFQCLREVKLCFDFNNFTVLAVSLEEFYEGLKREKNVKPRNVCRFTFTICSEIDYFLRENTRICLEELIPGWKEREADCSYTVDSLKQFLFEVVEQVREYLKNVEAHYELISRAKWMISKRYQENLSLQEVAELLNVNPSYFSSLFKRKTGTSFIAYLTNYRINVAVKLLRTTNESVEEIAYQVGYPNANYFIKVFKKTVGMTVSDFKKSI